MLSINKNALAIVISDVHLGDLFCKFNEFELFLDNLLKNKIQGNFPYLRALILLGDTFDIIMNTFWNLCNGPEFRNIFYLLNSINNNGIDVVIVLGNHEISTTGSYNLLFESRKNEFLKNMLNNGFSYNFLSSISLCQYAIIGKTEENQLGLLLYDSVYKIKYNHNDELVSSNRNFILSQYYNFNDKSYFMTHGYQFENWYTHHIIRAPWWSIFMGYDPDSKSGLNKFWYNWRTQQENFNQDAFYQYLKSQGIGKESVKGVHISKFIENEIYEKKKHFYDNALKFLNLNGFNKITNIIFGHIHEVQEVQKENKIMIINGCWLQNKESYFTEINLNGEYRLRKI